SWRISAYIRATKVQNVKKPLAIDVSQPWEQWAGLSQGCCNVIVIVNLLHFLAQGLEGLFQGVGQLLKPGGVCLIYGPFAVNGIISPKCNVELEKLQERCGVPQELNSSQGLQQVCIVVARCWPALKGPNLHPAPRRRALGWTQHVLFPGATVSPTWESISHLWQLPRMGSHLQAPRCWALREALPQRANPFVSQGWLELVTWQQLGMSPAPPLGKSRAAISTRDWHAAQCSPVLCWFFDWQESSLGAAGCGGAAAAGHPQRAAAGAHAGNARIHQMPDFSEEGAGDGIGPAGQQDVWAWLPEANGIGTPK
uniref:Uncharacterized protein n=1 Tax=Chelydra serpentina TaxID=8475 RepID=A0A8C3SF22_CHESE